MEKYDGTINGKIAKNTNKKKLCINCVFFFYFIKLVNDHVVHNQPLLNT